MAPTKVIRKAGRQHRHNQPERSKNTPPSHHLANPSPGAQENSDGKQQPSYPVPALLAGPQADAPVHAGRQSTPLALIAHATAAQAVPATKYRSSTVMGALLVSVCVIAIAIFSFGTSKTTRSDMQMAQADSAMLPITPAPESGTGAPTAAAATDKKASAARTNRADAKSTTTASKSGSPATRTEKKAVQAQAKPAAQQVADKAKSKPAPTVAKAPKKAPDDNAMPLLAQNTVTTNGASAGAWDNYAQCQELGSFLRREQCKWQVCSGKWGQNGCPSYASESRDYY